MILILLPPRQGGNPRPKTAPISPSTGVARIPSCRHSTASLTKRDTNLYCTSESEELRRGTQDQHEWLSSSNTLGQTLTWIVLYVSIPCSLSHNGKIHVSQQQYLQTPRITLNHQLSITHIFVGMVKNTYYIDFP